MAIPASQIKAAPEHVWSSAIGSGLSIEATCDAGNQLVADFFQGYDRAFVLKDEKEPLSGFTECLTLNHGADYDRLAARYGAYREIVLVARDKSGARAGGANFISFPIAASGGVPRIGTNLNYIYVEKSARGRGYLNALLTGIADFIPRLFGTSAPAMIFIEQNDPFRMDDKAYALDTSYTGLDQFDRLAIWLHEGAQIVDFAYVQPTLGPGQSPDDTLIYALLNPQEPRLDPCLLRAHLERFFAISVLKGSNPDLDPSASKQLQSLTTKCAQAASIDLLNMPSSMMERAKEARNRPVTRPGSLRDFIRGEMG